MSSSLTSFARTGLAALAFIGMFSTAHAQQATVAVKIQGPQQQPEIQFAGAPRLTQVYQEAQNQGVDLDSIYWPGVRLVSADKHAKITEQQRQLVRDLYALQNHFKSKGNRSAAQMVSRVAAQVATWPLVGAEPIGRGHVEQGPKNITAEVDINKKSALTSHFDEARFNLNANPVLPEGSVEQPARYQLLLPTIAEHQVPHLQLVGAVWVPFTMKYHPHFTARETSVVEKLPERFERFANQDELVQITVAGHIEKLGIAPYNATSQKFSAGAKVVVLFDESVLPSKFKHINEQLIELAQFWNPLIPQLKQHGSHFTTVGNLVADKKEPPHLWLGEAKQNLAPTISNFGGVGLLQMPTGRHAKQGEFSFTYADEDEYRRWGLNLQLFPWLETTIRYNDIRTRRYSPFEEFSGNQTYKDRGVDLKFRLFKESRWLPETSVGIRDLAGTGLFAGEYIAASKRFGNFDFTAGVGWGYLGKNGNVKNPFCEIANSFCTRPSGTTGKGGVFETDKWFRGDSAWFGGVEYQTPWDPLTVKLEYDSNNYQNEPARVPIPQDSRWNLGVEYKLSNALSLKTSYERGNTFMFGITFRTNFSNTIQPKRDTPKRAPQPPALNSVDELRDDEVIADLRSALYNEAGISAQDLVLSEDGTELTIYGSQVRYRQQEISIEKMGRILANELPAGIEHYHFVDSQGSKQFGRTSIDAIVFKDAVARNNINATTQHSYSRSEAATPATADEVLYHSEFEFAKKPTLMVKPYLQQSFGGPESFYMYQLGLDARAGYALSPNTIVYGTVGLRIADNYDKFNYTSGTESGPLPRVRTHVREYVTGTDVFLRNLQVAHYEQLGKDWFVAGYAGYFETMFGGAGAEVLYRELDSNWALGLDVNYAKQRDWDDHFSFRNYDVVTGHLTGYWQPSFFENSFIRVAAGRFLAGDKGVQVNFEHKFDSGIIVGAFAAKTNVSAEDFGEGSFNKGFYISIPFDILQLQHSRGRGSIGWVPLTRDGGQMLGRSFSLYSATDKRSPYYTD